MKKFIKFPAILCLLSIVLMLAACSSNEPCVYCTKTPTKSYSTENGDIVYICKEHRSTCFFCEKKATKHYTDSGFEIFTCKEHYEAAMAAK